MSKSRETFVRLAEQRTRRTMKDIRLIGNLSNRSNYSWREEDMEKIFSAIDTELKVAKQRFTEARASGRPLEFSLDESD